MKREIGIRELIERPDTILQDGESIEGSSSVKLYNDDVEEDDNVDDNDDVDDVDVNDDVDDNRDSDATDARE